MENVYIGFDFSINKPAATIYYKNNYYHYFWPLHITAKQQKLYEDCDVFIKNRMMKSIDKKTIESSQLVLIHTIRSTDLANLIINDIDDLILNKFNLTEYNLYVCSEGLSYASKGDATLNLATYKGVLLSKIYEHYDERLKRLFTYAPITIKSVAGCANKQDINEALSATEIAELLDLNSIEKRHWSIVPCSAQTRTGIQDGFSWIVNDIGSRLFTHP